MEWLCSNWAQTRRPKRPSSNWRRWGTKKICRVSAKIQQDVFRLAMIATLLIHKGHFHNANAVFLIWRLLYLLHSACSSCLPFSPPLLAQKCYGVFIFPQTTKVTVRIDQPTFDQSRGWQKKEKLCSVTDVTGKQRGVSAALPSLTTLTHPYYVLCEHQLSSVGGESALTFMLHLATELIFCTVAATHVHARAHANRSIQWASSAHITSSHIDIQATTVWNANTWSGETHLSSFTHTYICTHMHM